MPLAAACYCCAAAVPLWFENESRDLRGGTGIYWLPVGHLIPTEQPIDIYDIERAASISAFHSPDNRERTPHHSIPRSTIIIRHVIYQATYRHRAHRKSLGLEGWDLLSLLAIGRALGCRCGERELG